MTAPADHVFLAACRGEPTPVTPVWFMRQAGRHLPEYRAARGEGSILHAIARPEVAAELTLQPVRRYGVDAAILYSDIVVPVAAIGFGVDVAPGTGPVVAEHHPAPVPEAQRADPQRLVGPALAVPVEAADALTDVVGRVATGRQRPRHQVPGPGLPPPGRGPPQQLG
jgi:uroporphyrinogen decarboxylase